MLGTLSINAVKDLYENAALVVRFCFAHDDSSKRIVLTDAKKNVNTL